MKVGGFLAYGRAQLTRFEVDPDRAAELARVAAHPQGPSRKLKANENDIFNGSYFHFRGLEFSW